jgi:hypothetical protein
MTMDKQFYYLDGKEQKGPFSLDQLKRLGIKSDTLVWAEDFENWKAAKEVAELSEIIRKTPPPPPIIDNTPSVTITTNKEDSEQSKTIVEDSDVKSWVTFKVVASIILFLGLTTFSVYYISNSKKSKLKKEITDKIDNVLGNKTVILDGVATLAVGELEETGYNSGKKNKDDLSYLFSEWWEKEKLYTIYKSTNGGFTIQKLTKQGDESFDIVKYYSGDMGYKKPAYSYNSPQYYDDPWGEGGRTQISSGYQSKNYRQSVRECYTSAFEFYTKEDRESPGAYTPGKFVDITNFPDLSNEYFFMDNREPRTISSSGIFASSWSTPEHGGNINNENWVVYVSTSGKHYELMENEEKIKKDFLTNLGIGLGILVFLLIIVLASKPKFFRNLYLFGKRWRNKSYEDQVLFFEHSFFGSHKFTEIINDNVSKGVLKITDKGNTINLSYPTKELFYKIEKVEMDNLTLVSLKDSSSISFLRIGAKQEEEIKQEEATTTQEEIPNE